MAGTGLEGTSVDLVDQLRELTLFSIPGRRMVGIHILPIHELVRTFTTNEQPELTSHRGQV